MSPDPLHVLLLLYPILFISFVAGTVDVRVTLISYLNPDSRDWNEQRCEVFDGTECDTIFQICLDKTTAPINGNLKDFICDYYHGNTDLFPNMANVDFSVGDTHGIPNPITFEIQHWQGGFQVKVATYDKDTLTHDDVIDIIGYTYNELPAANLTDAGEGKNISEYGVRDDRKTLLTFNILAYCSEFFYTSSPTDPCSVVCKPENTPAGHYICGDMGQRVCLPGWEDEANSCLVPSNREDLPTTSKTNSTLNMTGNSLNPEQVSSKDPDAFSIHKNLIIGLIAGLVLLLLIIILLIALLLRNRRKRKLKDQATNANVNTAAAGQQTSALTTEASAGTIPYDNPLYDQQGQPAAEGTYSEVDYSMVKLPLGYTEPLPAAAGAKAREAEANAAYYDRNLKYNPKNTQPSPYTQREMSRTKYVGQGHEGFVPDGEDMRSGFSPLGDDSTMYGFKDSRFDNPTYDASNFDTGASGKGSSVKAMAGLYEEPIKVKI